MANGALDRHPMKRSLLILGIAAGLFIGPTDLPFAGQRGQGNSANAPGHGPGGPGTSENAPGHERANRQNAPQAHGRAAGGRAGGSRDGTVILPAQLLPGAQCPNEGAGGCRVPHAGNGPSEIAAPSTLPRGSTPAGALGDAMACREGIVRAATPYNARRIDAFTVGEPRSVEDGRIVPLFVRIVYPTASGYEVRQATVTCQLNASGAAIALHS